MQTGDAKQKLQAKKRQIDELQRGLDELLEKVAEKSTNMQEAELEHAAAKDAYEKLECKENEDNKEGNGQWQKPAFPERFRDNPEVQQALSACQQAYQVLEELTGKLASAAVPAEQAGHTAAEVAGNAGDGALRSAPPANGDTDMLDTAPLDSILESPQPREEGKGASATSKRCKSNRVRVKVGLLGHRDPIQSPASAGQRAHCERRTEDRPLRSRSWRAAAKMRTFGKDAP